MKNVDKDNRLTFSQIEQLLTPHFAPSAEEIKLPEIPYKSTNSSSKRFWVNMIRFGGIAAALIIGVYIIIAPNNTVSAKVYEVAQLTEADKMPTFQGKDLTSFCYWMSNNIEYPQEAIEMGLEGKVVFSFIVEKDGSLSEFKVLQSPSEILTKEIERIFNASPKWEPGEHNGEKIRVRFAVPVVLAIQK